MLRTPKTPNQIYRTQSHFVIGLVAAAFTTIVSIGYMFETEKDEVLVAAAIFLISVGFVSLRFAFAGIRATSDGIRVSNIFSSFDLTWNEVRRFHVGRSGIFPYVCLIELKDGSTRRAFGIQERTNFPDGSAEKMASELNKRPGQEDL